MQIGGFFIVTAIAFLYCLFKKKGMIKAAIFFAAFCESSVFYTSSFNLNPGHFFVFLAIASSAIISLQKGKSKLILKQNRNLVLFVMLLGCSIIVSYIFRIKEQVYSVGGGHALKSSLVGAQNFTQYLYVVVGFTFYCMCVNYMRTDKEWNECIKITIFAAVAVMLIAVYQLYANSHGLPFVTIFKNPYKIQWQTMLRAQSVMGEASFLGQYCVFIIAILFSPELQIFKSKSVKIGVQILLLIITLLTFSTTAVLGGISVLITYVLLSDGTIKSYKRVFIGGAFAIVAAFFLYRYNTDVQQLFTRSFDKLFGDNYSGVERREIFSYMMNVGMKYPLFGVGFGGGRSRDLYSNLFATTGIIGLGAFLVYVIKDMITLYRKKREYGSRTSLCLLTVLLVTSLTMPDITYLPFWLFLGIVDSRSKISSIKFFGKGKMQNEYRYIRKGL